MWQLRGLVASSGSGGVSSVADTLREVLAEVAEAYNQVRQHTTAQLRPPRTQQQQGEQTPASDQHHHRRPAPVQDTNRLAIGKKKKRFLC